MWRSFLLLAVFSVGASSADAQRWNRYGDSYGGYGWGTGYGISTAKPIAGSPFLYDPYATGRFRAPDLMDDPYFRARHKFDSRYPGRYAPRPPMRLKPGIPQY